MTSKDELLGMLRDEKARKDAEEKVDWDAKRTEWVTALHDLRAMVREWLKDAIAEGLLEVEDHDFAVSEEQLGSYDAPGMVIKTPKGHLIQMKPIARVIIGGQGRVDLLSGANKVMLIKGDGASWGVGVRTHRRPKVTELSEDVFAQILSELVR